MADYAGLLDLFTLALLGVAILQVWLGFRTDRTARLGLEIANRQMLIQGKQTDIVEKQHAVGRLQFIATHRPRLVIRDVHIGDTGYVAPVVIMATVANLGATAATVVRSTGFGCVAEEPLPWPRLTGDTPNPFGDATIGDGKSVRVSISTDYTNASLGDWKRNPGWSLYFIGSIVYSDDAGNIREVRFARRYDSRTGRFTAISDPDYEVEE